ncbi:MAG: DinB family protein [Acidobacteria bacterium]|nr:DinB family protein [Acidobacteriota bacterium]
MDNIIYELKKITEDAQKTFGYLNTEQINWKPSAESWSVGQCFEHLIKSNAELFPALDKIGSGTWKNSFYQNYSPLTSFWGNLLVKSLQKDTRKFKTPSVKIVPPSDVSRDIVERFAENQAEVIAKIKAAEKADLQKTVITSPFAKFMTYRLADGYRIIVEHERRHFRQAERVLQAEGFPNQI